MPLRLLPRSLRSRPPRAWRATGERCPPTAGVFIGCRLTAIRAAVAIAYRPHRLRVSGALYPAMPLLWTRPYTLGRYPVPPHGGSRPKCREGFRCAPLRAVRPCGLPRATLRLRSPLTAFSPVGSRPPRPRGCRPSGAAAVLAVRLPRCSSFLSLGFQWKTLSLGARRSRPPHDPISIEPTLRTLNDE